jgi:hypothetical protein
LLQCAVANDLMRILPKMDASDPAAAEQLLSIAARDTPDWPKHSSGPYSD